MDSVRHEQIMRAAVEVFVERGYRGTSIDAVAERAGLTRQGVLHYYPSKKRLYFALLHFREALTRQHVDHDDEPPDMACRFAEALEFDLGIPRSRRCTASSWPKPPSDRNPPAGSRVRAAASSTR